MPEDNPGAPRLTVSAYRDSAGSLPDIPEAWVAHRERAKVLAEVVSESGAFQVVDAGDFNDETRTHEFAEAILEIIKHPAAQVALSAAAVYVLKILTKPLDKKVEEAVGYLYDKLFSAFRKNRIGEFFITLPDGQRIRVDSNSDVEITVRDGKLHHLKIDTLPASSSGP
jgi:hypothetical protein